MISHVKFIGYTSRLKAITVNVFFDGGPVICEYMAAQYDGKGNCLFFYEGKTWKIPADYDKSHVPVIAF